MRQRRGTHWQPSKDLAVPEKDISRERRKGLLREHLSPHMQNAGVEAQLERSLSGADGVHERSLMVGPCSS